VDKMLVVRSSYSSSKFTGINLNARAELEMHCGRHFSSFLRTARYTSVFSHVWVI